MAQFAPMVDQVGQCCGKTPEQWLVDGGFLGHDRIDAVEGKTDIHAPVLEARAKKDAQGTEVAQDRCEPDTAEPDGGGMNFAETCYAEPWRSRDGPLGSRCSCAVRPPAAMGYDGFAMVNSCPARTAMGRKPPPRTAFAEANCSSASPSASPDFRPALAGMQAWRADALAWPSPVRGMPRQSCAFVALRNSRIELLQGLGLQDHRQWPSAAGHAGRVHGRRG